MPSSLPTESTLPQAVNVFGIGTYDSQRDNDGSHGEDSEQKDPPGDTLPQEGGPLDPFGPDRLLGYPQIETSQGKHSSAAAALPSDNDRPPVRKKSEDEIIADPVQSVAQTKLPSDEGNPTSRSDYFDDTHIGCGCPNCGLECDRSGSEYDPAFVCPKCGHGGPGSNPAGATVEYMWPSQDSGAWASELPSEESYDDWMDNWLQALGNYWSGSIIQDQAGSAGFPSTDFAENASYSKTNDDTHGGQVLATSGIMKERNMSVHTATNLHLVGDLTAAFLKKCGKKNITRRDVMAFLQDEGYGDRQFMASDIVRCLKHRHKITIADVLDQFPVKTASDIKSFTGHNISTIRQSVASLIIQSKDPGVIASLNQCLIGLSRVLERTKNG